MPGVEIPPVTFGGERRVYFCLFTCLVPGNGQRSTGRLDWQQVAWWSMGL